MPENQREVEVDDEYEDVISFKKVSEMAEPVISPHTGHIYDKADILRWITINGKDPIAQDKILTPAMLVSGFAIKKVLKKHKLEIAELENGLKDLKDILKVNNEMLKANREQFGQLQKESVNMLWLQHGGNIEKKLKKGSTPVRERALQEYKNKVLKSDDNSQLKQAVQDTEKFESPKISERRWFKSFFKGPGDTTKVALEFKKQVNFVKGWD